MPCLGQVRRPCCYSTEPKGLRPFKGFGGLSRIVSFLVVVLVSCPNSACRYPVNSSKISGHKSLLGGFALVLGSLVCPGALQCVLTVQCPKFRNTGVGSIRRGDYLVGVHATSPNIGRS